MGADEDDDALAQAADWGPHESWTDWEESGATISAPEAMLLSNAELIDRVEAKRTGPSWLVLRNELQRRVRENLAGQDLVGELMAGRRQESAREDEET